MKLGWILLGTAAVGGGGYYLYYRSKHPSAAPAAPAAGASTAAGAMLVSSAPVTLSYTVNGRSVTEQYNPSSSQLASDIQRAGELASIGHGPGKEGELWAHRAVVDGANATQLATLRSQGYSV